VHQVADQPRLFSNKLKRFNKRKINIKKIFWETNYDFFSNYKEYPHNKNQLDALFTFNLFQ
jgi:hypothetical protein